MIVRLLTVLWLSLSGSCFAQVTDLLQAYRDALQYDPTYLGAISTNKSQNTLIAQSIALILPQLSANANPFLQKTHTFSSQQPMVPNISTKQYTVTLNLSQTVFDFGQFANIGKAYATAASSDASLNAALQDLMVRVATAYLNILRDEEQLIYTKAIRDANAKQLDQARQQFKVGVKTITDVYTAESAYELGVANVIGAETTLSNDRDNLRAITGKRYEKIAPINEQFPLVSPNPQDVNAWAEKAITQNWTVKAQQQAVREAAYEYKIQFAGNLPTVSIEGSEQRYYQKNAGNLALYGETNPTIQNIGAIGLVVNVPIVAGGSVLAKTAQAGYNYDTAKQQLELAMRTAENNARQSYLGVLSNISRVKADKVAVKSAKSALDGLEEGYQVGTQTMVDVLTQRQVVFQAQTNYATDRYAAITNMLTLKQAAGTLSFNDLAAINGWLKD